MPAWVAGKHPGTGSILFTPASGGQNVQTNQGTALSALFGPGNLTLVALCRSLIADGNFREVVRSALQSFFILQNSSNTWAWAPHGTEYSDTTTPMTVGEWALLAGTWSNVTTSGKLYKNGIPYQSISTGGAIATGTNGFYFGNFGSGSQLFNGNIAMIAMYNRVLSQSEIQWLTAEPYAVIQLKPVLRRWVGKQVPLTPGTRGFLPMNIVS